MRRQEQAGPDLRRVRCAIYTRKSTDENLDSEFNSLDAQRESAESYIASQRHEGWMALQNRYDDGGFSGGTLERPGLERLLEDIEAGRVDCVVVYKLDRLSRSLLDFVRLIEVFDQHQVAFVSVTQRFDTSTSMGRLMLNILLSFAQFEREIIGERIRDKVAATKKRGKYCGGMPVLGYDVDRERKRLILNPAEAERVRHVFQRFVQTGSITELVKELNAAGHLTKSWTTKNGALHAGRRWDKRPRLPSPQQPALHRRSQAQGGPVSWRARGHRQPRALGQDARNPRHQLPLPKRSDAGQDPGPAQRHHPMRPL